ncbi:MAG: hypothetical protein IIA62_08170, partial [Nitrospinae bacterium]|nr:hypothetical protein [Nitrospinota bacterium]
VCLWDKKSTEVLIPPPPRIDYGRSYRGQLFLPEFNDNRFRASFQLGENTFSMIDLKSNTALFWARDASELPYWVTGAPLRTLLHWWLGSKGVQLVHGAAVGTEKGGALLTAKGGSGKSTVALACLQAGLNYFGDDYVAIGRDPDPLIHSLYSSGKLERDQIKNFPNLKPLISNPDKLDEEKALIFLHQKYPNRLPKCVPLKAILIPRFSGEKCTRITEALPKDALLGMVPTTMFQLPLVDKCTFKNLKKFVETIPCYFLETGTDISLIPDVLIDFIEQAH